MDGLRNERNKKGMFVKGVIPWNKGLKHTQTANSGSFKVGQFKNEKHVFWKGDNASYLALHNWIKRHYGRAKKCINGHIAKRYVWANISGEYKRDISDWHELCDSCNFRDGIKINSRFRKGGARCVSI